MIQIILSLGMAIIFSMLADSIGLKQPSLTAFIFLVLALCFLIVGIYKGVNKL